MSFILFSRSISLRKIKSRAMRYRSLTLGTRKKRSPEGGGGVFVLRCYARGTHEEKKGGKEEEEAWFDSCFFQYSIYLFLVVGGEEKKGSRERGKKKGRGWTVVPTYSRRLHAQLHTASTRGG